MNLTHVRRLQPSAVPGEVSAPREVISGQPRQVVGNQFTDPSGQFFAGFWESSPGSWRVNYTESEFCFLLEGRIVLTDEGGASMTFVAGDAFVVPAGFRGTWEVVEPARKYYAIFEAAGG